MNKKRLSVGIVTLLTATGMLASCGKDDPTEKTISKVSLKGVYDAYTLDETIDWSNVSIVVKYSDNTSVTISTSDIEFDVETATKETTKAIINTNGLYGLTTLTEQDYDIKVVLVENLKKEYAAGQISVGDISPEHYTLSSFAKPNFVTIYESTKANAGKELSGTPTKAELDAQENYFKKGDEIFTVGNLNDFKFVPTAMFARKGVSGQEAYKISDSYKKTVTVEVKNGESYEAASTSDYITKRDGVKFGTTAAGKQFRLTVKPAEFTVSNPATFEFKVENGLNIYSAKELGALNLTSVTADMNAGDDYYENKFATGKDRSAKIFLNSAGTDYEGKDTFLMWENFLKDSGTFTSDEVSAYRDAPAYFFMNDLTIKPEDIPNEFFIKENEKVNTNNSITGALRDESLIYHIIPNVAKTINGNYYKVDSSAIPLCMSNTNGGFHSIKSDDMTVDPGHAILFYASGMYTANNDEYFAGSTYKDGVNPVVFKNINTIGNTGKDLGHSSATGDENFKKMAKLTGLVAFKGGALPFTVDNCIAKQYMIGMFVNSNLSKYNNNPSAQLKNSRIYDCANAGSFNYQCQNYAISNSELKRFGGAAMFNVGHMDKKYYAGYTYADEACVVENYVTGEEVYFTAVGAAGQIGTLKGLNGFFVDPNPAHAPFVHKIDNVEYMNVISLSMEDGYMASKEKTFYAKTVINGKNAIDLGSGVANQLYESVHSMLGSYAPIVAFDEGITILNNNNDLTQGMKTIPTEFAVGIIVFNPEDPTSMDTVIPEQFFGEAYGPGVYVPELNQQYQPYRLGRAVAYSGEHMHLCVPVAGTSLNLILGI